MKDIFVNQKKYAVPDSTAQIPPQAKVARSAKGVWVFDKGRTFFVEAARRALTGASGENGDGTVVSPMPGKIFKLFVKAGDPVQEGQDLLVLEAMKMEHTLKAPFAGSVSQCDVKVGALVELGQTLVTISPKKK